MGEALNLAILMTLKDEASKHFGSIKGGLGGIKTAALAIGGAALGGVGILTAGLVDAAKAAQEEQKGINKLAAAVKASGGDWGKATSKIEEYLTAELKRTALDDGEGREAIMHLTTATGDYQQALDLMTLTQDLAAAKGIDLASAAQIVGKVSQGQLGTLSRYGIVMKEGATATEALTEMQRRFAGQAEATMDPQKKLNVALGNLKETIGAHVLPLFTGLVNTGADLAIRVLPLVEGAATTLGTALTTALGWAEENVLPMVQGFATAFTGEKVDTKLVDIGLDAGTRILDGFWEKLGEVSEKAVTLTDNLLKWATDPETVADLQETASKITDWVIDEIKRLFSKTETGEILILGLAENLGKASLSLGKVYTVLGATIVTGIVQGILSALLGEEAGKKFREGLANFIRQQTEWAVRGAKPIAGTGGQYYGPPEEPWVEESQRPGPIHAQYGLRPTWFTHPAMISVGERESELVSVTPRSRLRSFAAAPVIINFTYAPAISLATEYEAYERLGPVLAEVMRREGRR